MQALLDLSAITLSPEQERAVDAMSSGRNVFFTGQAGTGKSTVTTVFISRQSEPVDVTATTGIAAMNLRDQFRARCGLQLDVSTVYRWAGMDLGPMPGESNEACWQRLCRDMRPSRAAAWRRCEKARVLFIDEISMLPGRTLDFLDYLLRRLRGRPSAPFGGLQVICVGDFLQLPPVSRGGGYDWAFQSDAWRGAGFRNVCLREVRRQGDPVFVDLLNALRRGRLTAAHTATLRKRVAVFPKSSLLRLFTHNVQVDKWNASMLDALPGDEHVFVMTEEPGPEVEWLKKQLLTPETLHLKRGARVMVTVNLTDSDTGALIAVNGSLGTVIGLDDDVVTVQLDDGREIPIHPFTWRANPLDEHAGSVTQFPLRLAWAATIHKSQGLSLDSALIDARATRDPGQTYVALSRVRSLQGVFLREMFTGVWVSEEAIQFMDAVAG